MATAYSNRTSDAGVSTGGLRRMVTPGGINASSDAPHVVASSQQRAAQDASQSGVPAGATAPTFAGLTPVGGITDVSGAFGNNNPALVEQEYTTPSGGTIGYVWEATQQWWHGMGVWLNGAGAGWNSGVLPSQQGLSAIEAAFPDAFKSPAANTPDPNNNGGGGSGGGSSATPDPNSAAGLQNTFLKWLSSLQPSTTGAGNMPGTSTPISSLGALQPIGTPTSTSGSPNVVLIAFALILGVAGVFWYLHSKHKREHRNAPAQ